MCRVEERVYISAEGHRSRFEDTFPCDKGRKGRLCSNVNKRTTEYYPKKGALSTRNDTPSPINPPTPTGAGTYVVQQRRPSSSNGRPHTPREGQKTLKPEIIIEFGANKSRGKKYPSVSVSTKAYKRSSNGGSSFEDIAVESPGSDASHTLRTGFPEAPLVPQAGVYGMSHGYGTALPSHHRHTSSTGSSRTPSLYVTSDPDNESPKTSRTTTRQPPAIHYPSSTVGEPSSPGHSRGGYSTTVITPHGISLSSETPESLHARDYPADRSASSYTSSAASGKSRRGKDPEYSRRRSAEEEEEENKKQVRFDMGRQEHRAKERSENALAEKEKERAASREEARLRERLQREAQDRRREDEATRTRTERPKPVISNTSFKRPSSRRGSMTMTRAEREEQQRLLAADLERMDNEQRAAEIRDRAERAALLKQQQEDPAYYSTRSGGIPSGLARRDPQSRRGSFTSNVRPTPGLARTTSNRRASIVQPNPPTINTQVAQGSYQRPPSARTRDGPPISFNNSSARPVSARRPSFSSQDLPFARGSAGSLDNPFAPVSSAPVTSVQDPWDERTTRDPAPSTQSDGRYSTQRREDVVGGAARQASRAMGRVAGMEYSAFETSSEDEDVRTHAPSRRRR